MSHECPGGIINFLSPDEPGVTVMFNGFENVLVAPPGFQRCPETGVGTVPRRENKLGLRTRDVETGRAVRVPREDILPGLQVQTEENLSKILPSMEIPFIDRPINAAVSVPTKPDEVVAASFGSNTNILIIGLVVIGFVFFAR